MSCVSDPGVVAPVLVDSGRDWQSPSRRPYVRVTSTIAELMTTHNAFREAIPAHLSLRTVIGPETLDRSPAEKLPFD